MTAAVTFLPPRKGARLVTLPASAIAIMREPMPADPVAQKREMDLRCIRLAGECGMPLSDLAKLLRDDNVVIEPGDEPEAA